MTRTFFRVGAALLVVAACGGRASLGDEYLEPSAPGGYGASAGNGGTGAVAGNGGTGAVGGNGGSGAVAGNGGAPNGPGPSTTVSVTTGPEDCDGTGQCDACIPCAAMGPCFGEVQMCQASPDCQAFSDCMQMCGGGGMGCFFQCAQDNPDGANEWIAMIQCFICDACPQDCDGVGPPQLCN
jgi:hypothetical protein